MHPNTYDNFSAVEETHWWFRHRRAVAREWLRRARVHHGVALDYGARRYRRPLDDLQTDRDLDISNTWTQRLVYAITGIERAWLRLGGRLPFGINVLIVARKRAVGR